MPTLLRLSFDGTEEQFPVLPGATIRIGRRTDYEVVAASRSVSVDHATIGSAADGRPWICDNGSANGTFVNGDRLPPNYEYLLCDGDVIRLGEDYEFTVHFTHSSPEPVTVRLLRGGQVVPLRLTYGSEMTLGRESLAAAADRPRF